MRKSLDSIELRALVLELQEGAPFQLQKVFQLSEADYWLQLAHRQEQGWVRSQLLICLRPDEARLHLVQADKPAAQIPSSFTMLLRKHLLDRRLLAIRQPDLERLVVLDFGAHQLVVLLPGRENNLVLTTPEGKILGGHRLGGALRPGQILQPPARPALPPADSLSGAQLLELLGDEPLDTLPTRVFGLPPRRARYLLGQAGQDRSRLAQLWDQYWSDLKCQRRPGLTAGGWLSFQAQPEDRPFPTMQEAAQAAWSESSSAPGLDAQRVRLGRRLAKLVEKGRRKLDNLQGDLEAAQQYAQLQHEGDLLLAHQSAVPEAASEVWLDDWSTGQPTRLELDPQLTPTQNAQLRYRTAKRRKRALDPLQRVQARVREELAFLEEAQLSCQRAESQSELDELAGCLPGQPGAPPRPKPVRPSGGPRRYRFGGFDILVGRNPAQNDQISTRLASRDDLWLHARGIPGAHVLIKTAGSEPGPEVIEAAAVLAARHSRSAQDTRVEVAYTLAQRVKKPPGSPPGRVLVQGEKTVMVDPHQDLAGLESLL